MALPGKLSKDDQEFQKVFHAEMDKWIVPRRERKGEKPQQVPSRDKGEPADEKGPPQPTSPAQGQYRPKVDHRLIGVALSGGGVRAATFSLGALQRLARLGVLRYADLLSTVSGGAYLGASWSSLTAPRPESDGGVTPSCYGSKPHTFPFRFIDNEAKPGRQILDRESPAVRHLRAYGNWLAPHLGILDIWTWVAILHYLVSTTINLLLLPLPWVLGIIGALLMVPHGLWDRRAPWDAPGALAMLAFPLVPLAVFGLLAWLETLPRPQAKPQPQVEPGLRAKGGTASLGQKVSLALGQKAALTLAFAGLLLDLFILGIAFFHSLEENKGFLHQIIADPDIKAFGPAVVSLLSIVAALFRLLPKGGAGAGAPKGAGAIRTVGLLLLGLAGYLVLGLLLLLGYYALDSLFFPDHVHRSPVPWKLLFLTLTPERLALGGFTVALVMLFMRVRWFLNTFSLQSLYRRALADAYILRPATPDEEKDLGRGAVVPRGASPLALSHLEYGNLLPDMPYHLIGTALNTSGDKQLERLGRRGDGFVFAHEYSGSRITGYRSTEDANAFKTISLEQAMTISGAALSPNMGRATTATLAALLTLFNIRIGTWIPNPDDEKRRWYFWRPVIWYWGKELFGMASAEDRHVYLTDGGHFDNSGLYELLKRRCKYIIAVDASLDPSSLGNLATAARLARIDLGVQMDIDLTPLQPDPSTSPPRSSQPYVVGRLKYPPVENDPAPTEGVLVFITTVLPRREKPDVLRYKEEHPQFPDDTTSDQLFDEAQFESYRQLGHTAVGLAFPDRLLAQGLLTRQEWERVFQEMEAQAMKAWERL